MDEWASTYSPADDIDTLVEDLVNAIHCAANSISYKQKDKWFHNSRVKELKHRLIQNRRILRRHPSPMLLASLRAATKMARNEIREIRTRVWLQWCESINTHTSLHELWTMLSIASGKYKKQPCHPQAQGIADNLITSFKTRGNSNIHKKINHP